MPNAPCRRLKIAGLVIALAWWSGSGPGIARADQAPPRVAFSGPSAPARHPFAPRGSAGHHVEGSSGRSGGWWLGTAAMALALALCGGISVAARRYLPQAGTGPLRVVGRTSLSPRHTVYLVEAGGRILIVGAGPQGPPALLGELTDPAVLPRNASGPPDPSGVLDRSTVGFDRQVGDDP